MTKVTYWKDMRQFSRQQISIRVSVALLTAWKDKYPTGNFTAFVNECMADEIYQSV